MDESQRQQQRESEAVALEGPYRSAEPLERPVIEAFAAIARRRDLLRSEVYRRHAEQLLELTYLLDHRPAAAPRPADGPGARDFIRALSWNIKRGSHLEGIVEFLTEHPVARHADVLMLNEVDIGMARSANRHVAAELGERLDGGSFGYVYGNSYLCLDHGDARDEAADAGVDNRESLHGNAILSRFPIRRAESFSIEISKDKFHSSEKRLGHKKALWAELETPRGPLPVVSVHLDAYASAAQRGAQLRDVLDKVAQRGLSERVLLGGDLNTNTYDAKHPGQILTNVARKVVRGGFPHAIHHYLHPYELYERPVFELIDARGLDYRAFNDLTAGTTRYEVGTHESESMVTEQLPGFAVKILRHKLRPWNGVAQLKVDWFFGRGLQVRQGLGGVACGVALARSPGPLERPMVNGVQLSDHDPIVVDVTF